jgi:hypothetical protein
MQHLILLVAISTMILYLSAIIGCLCYIGRRKGRMS